MSSFATVSSDSLFQISRNLTCHQDRLNFLIAFYPQFDKDDMIALRFFSKCPPETYNLNATTFDHSDGRIALHVKIHHPIDPKTLYDTNHSLNADYHIFDWNIVSRSRFLAEKVRKLTIRNVNDDAFMAKLLDLFPNIKYLEIVDCKVTRGGFLDYFIRAKRIQEVTFNRCSTDNCSLLKSENAEKVSLKRIYLDSISVCCVGHVLGGALNVLYLKSVKLDKLVGDLVLALSFSDCLPKSLEDLTLEDCNLGEGHMPDLIILFQKISTLLRLRNLNLGRNNLDLGLVIGILPIVGERLESLNLAFNQFYRAKESLISTFLCHLNIFCGGGGSGGGFHLKNLDIRGNFIGAKLLYLTNFGFGTFDSMRTLSLDCSSLDFRMIEIWSEFKVWNLFPNLKTLSLSYNRLGPYGCSRLVWLLSSATPRLQELDLSGTFMGLSSPSHEHQDYWDIVNDSINQQEIPLNDNQRRREYYVNLINAEFCESFCSLTHLEKLLLRKCNMDSLLISEIRKMAFSHVSMKTLDLREFDGDKDNLLLLLK